MLCAMMDAETRGQPGSGSGSRLRSLAWSIALGLVLGAILATVLVGLRPEDTGIAEVDVVFLDAAGPGPGAPYVVELELEREGYPVVVHVDRDGLPSLLFPASRPMRLPPGMKVRLPDPHGAATWWSAAGEDGGSLLVAIAERPPADTDRLLDLAERAASRADDAAGARDEVRAVLRRRLGPPVSTEIGRAPERTSRR